MSTLPNNIGLSNSSIEDKRRWIEEKIDSLFSSTTKFELLAIDFELNLLVSAAQSYKHESVLKPFPSTFLNDFNNDKNYDLLLSTLLTLPPVTTWKTKSKSFTKDQLSLIYWLLTHKNYQLEYCTSLNKDKLKDMAKYTENFSDPTHVFEIKYNDDKNRKFETLKQQTSEIINTTDVTSINFHGTRMDNIYSICHSGLLSHMNKNGIFGEGTYLSQEPSISLHYSPSCTTWEHSIIGQRMSCLLVCESINDPSHVKIGVNEKSNVNNINSNKNNNDANGKTNIVKNLNGVPEKYFIVKNDEYVRVKYILVYAEKAKIKRKNNIMRFFSENKLALLMISYTLLLIFVGLLNSRAFHKFFRLGYKRLSNFILGDASSSTAYE